MTFPMDNAPQRDMSSWPSPEQDSDLDTLLNTHFAGRVVRKDLTQRVKEGATCDTEF